MLQHCRARSIECMPLQTQAFDQRFNELCSPAVCAANISIERIFLGLGTGYSRLPVKQYTQRHSTTIRMPPVGWGFMGFGVLKKSSSRGFLHSGLENNRYAIAPAKAS